ncbi:MAG: AraC family transcriptional regulator [Ruminococcaceae bacterium]|nr:AraC family transcriptional regulator [Oscillospiraceae bacterium]
MFTSPICGIKTEHAGDYTFKKPSGTSYWLLMRFYTPFYYEANGERFEGKAGELLLNPPDTPLVHGSLDGNGFCNDWIYIGGDGLPELISELGIPTDRAFCITETLPLEKILGEIYAEMKSCAAGYTHKISAHIASLLVDIGRACKSDGLQSGTKITPYARSISSVHTALAENCGYHWTLTEMSELSGYSVSRFCSLYKAKYGITPIEHLISSRISKAKQLLRLRRHNVTEVSELCGFSSLHYFSMTFKKHTGLSPSEYMDSHAKKEVL